jgi:hypothetical protein
MLKPPSKEELELLPPLTKHPVHIRKGSSLDVLISGLGWIKINSLAGAELEVHIPKGVKLSIRESLI